MRLWFALLFLFAPVGLLYLPNEPTKESPPAAVSVAKKPINIRMLILKHSRERIADNDADLALKAITNASGKGLQIRCIGNHFFTEPVDGQVSNDEFTTILMNPDEQVRMERFQFFVSREIKIDAKPKDTLIIFTIGHGATLGRLHNLGQRALVMKALANAAEENNQQVIWWQLSCYASAQLPALSTLPEKQQKLFSIVASSNTQQESVVDLQGKIMDKLFTALVEKSTKLDANGDGIIVASELDAYLRSGEVPHQGGGPILYALTPNAIMFGTRNLDLRIFDRIGAQGQYPEDYIPIPD